MGNGNKSLSCWGFYSSTYGPWHLPPYILLEGFSDVFPFFLSFFFVPHPFSPSSRLWQVAGNTSELLTPVHPHPSQITADLAWSLARAARLKRKGKKRDGSKGVKWVKRSRDITRAMKWNVKERERDQAELLLVDCSNFQCHESPRCVRSLREGRCRWSVLWHSRDWHVCVNGCLLWPSRLNVITSCQCWCHNGVAVKHLVY